MARHYDITDWADFSRAIDARADRAAMQRHLDDGCEACRSTVSTLERVFSLAEADGAVAPPAGAVRSVNAFFSLQHPRAAGRWARSPVRRSFDSAVVPAVASRASHPEVRQLLYESDDYTLELSVDYSPGTVDAVLRGQILEAQGEPRSHTPVFLVGDGEVLGRTISQQHGTFELCGRLDLPCELWVFPDDENRIRLRLKPEH